MALQQSALRLETAGDRAKLEGGQEQQQAGLSGQGATWRATLVEILEKSASVSTWMLYSARMGRLYMVAWNSSAAEHRRCIVSPAYSSAPAVYRVTLASPCCVFPASATFCLKQTGLCESRRLLRRIGREWWQQDWRHTAYEEGGEARQRGPLT